ncbi:MAG: hypothetical protein KDC39_07455 [Actinobacteria bacterium]|nr:hypothetical protein [Actinomycetota bacterium]
MAGRMYWRHGLVRAIDVRPGDVILQHVAHGEDWFVVTGLLGRETLPSDEMRMVPGLERELEDLNTDELIIVMRHMRRGDNYQRFQGFDLVTVQSPESIPPRRPPAAQGGSTGAGQGGPAGTQ